MKQTKKSQLFTVNQNPTGQPAPQPQSKEDSMNYYFE
jgi:hypothetical protein